MRWVNPSIATVSPSRTQSSTASARDRKRGINRGSEFEMAWIIYGARQAGSNGGALLNSRVPDGELQASRAGTHDTHPTEGLGPGSRFARPGNDSVLAP